MNEILRVISTPDADVTLDLKMYPHLLPPGRGVTMADVLAAGDLLRDAEGVAAPDAAVAALLLVTSASNRVQDSIPSLLPFWLTEKDSQWLARSEADREKRLHRATPFVMCLFAFRKRQGDKAVIMSWALVWLKSISIIDESTIGLLFSPRSENTYANLDREKGFDLR